MTTEIQIKGFQQDGAVYEVVRDRNNWYLLFKRFFDLGVCLLMLPFITVLIALLSIMIMIDSPGTPFFIQERVGKGGRRFRMYKFRTMSNDYDDRQDRVFMQAFVVGQIDGDHTNHASVFKPISKQHITRVGGILRKASLDELPQIFNILRGDMSLVGPRPNTLWEVEAYLDWHRERLEVLPGITGLAQVNGRSKITFDKIALYDIQYVRNLSLGLDFWILGQTVWIVLTGKGAG